MYTIDGFRRKAGGVIGSVGVLDGYAVNWLFPCMGRILAARGGCMLEFVQGLSKVSGNRYVARIASLVLCNCEAAV